jgi:hypothetical protein
VDELSSVVLALILGASFGFSLRHQIALQQLARREPQAKEGSFLQRITFAGLSGSLMVVTILAAKFESSIGRDAFILTASAAAIAVLILGRSR